MTLNWKSCMYYSWWMMCMCSRLNFHNFGMQGWERFLTEEEEENDDSFFVDCMKNTSDIFGDVCWSLCSFLFSERIFDNKGCLIVKFQIMKMEFLWTQCKLFEGLISVLLLLLINKARMVWSCLKFDSNIIDWYTVRFFTVGICDVKAGVELFPERQETF